MTLKGVINIFSCPDRSDWIDMPLSYRSDTKCPLICDIRQHNQRINNMYILIMWVYSGNCYNKTKLVQSSWDLKKNKHKLFKDNLDWFKLEQHNLSFF